MQEGSLSLTQIRTDWSTKPSKYWLAQREKNTLKLFHDAAQRIPAYKDFLKKAHIKPEKIVSWDDFQNVPPMSKKNYLRQYDLKDLCWDGTLNKPMVFTATSGSTGEPFYFMRQNMLDWQYSVLIEDWLRSFGKPVPTLAIVGFGMGVWIGGLITYKAFEIASQRLGYPLSILTPGINKGEIFNALKILAPHYKRVILIGYPPFIKDIIDELPTQGIELKKLDLKTLFAAEAITEKFRDYIFSKAHMSNIYYDTMSIYGSADIGAMAMENATSILVKRLAMSNKKAFDAIFSPISKTPTLAQYNPQFINFESQDGEVILTGNSALPLIRYAIGDSGGVISFEEASNSLNKHGIHLSEEAQNRSVQLRRLPFVYVYERTDFMVKLNLHEIYPEMIRDALISPELINYLTGKFTMTTRYDDHQNQYLQLDLELKIGKKVSKKTESLIYKHVLESFGNAPGPGNIHDFLNIPNLVRFTFWPKEDPKFFQPGVKQKWIKKDPQAK